ncbi:DeoR/GlpR family DNA-binding transcription regulator [Youxingia wuxianensis]|uniref:Lactose phosphotransferase system repressor n=1 Tax=Youxingia wuxianensis TaxID=2763678 RepID=A0A926IC33_9FIRM|nr:DeoR/GlpR family DNA-binding transcription regulator [Youxingia wuxianensis]MBC8584772.1 DeoR/GlpR transcriptional regulator [Youxingia wuxianensis]
MIASERAIYILNRLKEKETVTLKEMSDELNVSVATVRRDFEKLDEKGLAIKVRSGATRATAPGIVSSLPLVTSEKSKENIEDKIEIARKAASYVQDGDCIFLDGGTTIAPMIDFIQNKKIKIITHNLLVPQRLQNMDVDIFLIGGHYSHFHVSTVGVYAEKMVSQFHFDHAFFGCSGIELVHQMAYNDDIDTIPVKEVAMKYSSHNYLLADASKLGITSYCRFSPLSAFDVIISNRKASNHASLPSNLIFADE